MTTEEAQDYCAGRMHPIHRAQLYNMRYPKRVPLGESGGMVGGCWMIGNQYRNPSRMPDGSPFYGSYPHGYLERVHSMFPDAKHILHVFSGGLTQEMAIAAAWPETAKRIANRQDPGHDWACKTMELVDLGGEGRHPTWEGNVETLPTEWSERFDLVLADPPYSKEDAAIYGPRMYNRRKVMTELHRVTAEGGNLVWVDTTWPQHRKDMWKTWGTVGLVRSTNHRMRLVTFFERQP